MSDNHFFALFDLPAVFDIDKSALKARLLDLQKQHHPDQHGTDSGQSALINHAFNTLYQDDSRAVYLLSLHGVVLDDTQSISDLDFLDTMIDIRMALDDGDVSQVKDLAGQTQALIDEYGLLFNQHFNNRDFTQAGDVAKKLQFLVKLHQDIEKHQTPTNTDNDDELYV